MNETKLGQLVLDGNKERDAVHIAVIPMIADERLEPGQKVCIKENCLYSAGVNAYIGVVDPFLRLPVAEGQTCYLCLYPNTITSLKHNWTHPAFPNDVQNQVVSINDSLKMIVEKMERQEKELAELRREKEKLEEESEELRCPC